MDFLPLFHQLQGQPCLLIGGGAVALRKGRLLVKAGAQLHVVATAIDPQLQALCTQSGGNWRQDRYTKQDLEGRFLVVAATDDQALNEQVSQDCHSRQLPVNVVDQPTLCSFIFPAIIDRSPITVAVSSGGQSPVLARQLRSQLESLIPNGYGALAR